MQYICVECGVVVRSGTTTRPQHCNRFMDPAEIPDAVIRVGTPYHNLVYHVIHEEGPIIGKQIMCEIGCSCGTVYSGLPDLEALGVIESRPTIGGNGHGEQWATTPDAFEDHTPDYEPLTP